MSVEELAKLMANICVRNTVIENYHSGITSRSKTGDYSDVKVVTPYGEIPWLEVSKISDPEMKAFNIEVTNNIYTFLKYLLGNIDAKGSIYFNQFVRLLMPYHWDEPEIKQSLMDLLEDK